MRERRHDETVTRSGRERGRERARASGRERENIDVIRADTMPQTNKLKICGVSALKWVLSIPGGMKELIPGENRFRGKLQ